MRTPTRREGIVWLAGAAALATGVAIASPGLVDGDAATAGTPGARDTLALSAMERDLGVSRGDARARLDRQEWAGSAERMLSEVVGDEFGGAWLGKDGRTFNVAVTTKSAAAKVRAAGATPKLVTYAADTLAEFRSDLDTGTKAGRGIAGWFVDPKTNSVTVLAKKSSVAAATSWAKGNGVAPGALRVVASDLEPKPLFDIRGGDPYFIENQFRCSVGFAVTGAGTSGFVTAGHCGAVGDTTTGFNQEAQGEVAVSTFPGDGDFGFVETNDEWVGQPVVVDADGGEFPVAGGEEAPVGAAVCRSGSTTGTFCGVIEAKDVTVNYPEGAVTGLTQTDVCAEGGDSGGSWLAGEQAQGVTSGGSGNCQNGGAGATTFFQPLDEILEAADVELVTTESGGEEPPVDPPATDPPATDPPATDPPVTDPPATDPPAGDVCEDVDESVEGSLEDAADSEVQPSIGFFVADAGEHVACVTPADADAEFAVALEQWSGLSFEPVATSEAGTLTFDGTAGFFRYVVTSEAGAGDYELGATVP